MKNIIILLLLFIAAYYFNGVLKIEFIETNEQSDKYQAELDNIEKILASYKTLSAQFENMKTKHISRSSLTHTADVKKTNRDDNSLARNIADDTKTLEKKFDAQSVKTEEIIQTAEEKKFIVRGIFSGLNDSTVILVSGNNEYIVKTNDVIDGYKISDIGSAQITLLKDNQKIILKYAE